MRIHKITPTTGTRAFKLRTIRCETTVLEKLNSHDVDLLLTRCIFFIYQYPVLLSDCKSTHKFIHSWGQSSQDILASPECFLQTPAPALPTWIMHHDKLHTLQHCIRTNACISFLRDASYPSHNKHLYIYFSRCWLTQSLDKAAPAASGPLSHREL